MSLLEELLAERGIRIVNPSENPVEETGDYETDCVPCEFKNQPVAECKRNCPLGKVSQ